MDRRQFSRAAAAAVALAVTRLAAAKDETADTPQKPDHDMSGMPASWMGNEQIAMLVYPGFTALDLIGPQYMFASLMGATVHLVAKTLKPVTSDTRVTFVPSMIFDKCPKDLDLIFVPGGAKGTLDAMQDNATLDFLADRGARAKRITSVCTGSLVLGAAGLLRGYQATSHWVARPLLADFGATPVDARVVRDRNRITGAGVTAGIDFGLSLVGEMRDHDYAESVQLLAEYDPQPPFDAGSPAKSKPQNLEMMRGMFDDFVKNVGRASRTGVARKES